MIHFLQGFFALIAVVAFFIVRSSDKAHERDRKKNEANNNQ